jgi:hypothetical protein
LKRKKTGWTSEAVFQGLNMMRRSCLMPLLACCGLAGALLAQAPPAPQTTPPAGGRGGQGAGGGGGRGGGRRGGFTQFTRPLASQDVLARGKALYETNCASCHAPDFRGTEKGTRLLRSLTSLNDQHGELIGRAVAEHNPKINLMELDTVAVAEYLHSVLATVGGQGVRPDEIPPGCS